MKPVTTDTIPPESAWASHALLDALPHQNDDEANHRPHVL
jgi:hypothetical protein